MGRTARWASKVVLSCSSVPSILRGSCSRCWCSRCMVSCLRCWRTVDGSCVTWITALVSKLSPVIVVVAKVCAEVSVQLLVWQRCWIGHGPPVPLRLWYPMPFQDSPSSSWQQILGPDRATGSVRTMAASSTPTRCAAGSNLEKLQCRRLEMTRVRVIRILSLAFSTVALPRRLSIWRDPWLQIHLSGRRVWCLRHLQYCSWYFAILRLIPMIHFGSGCLSMLERISGTSCPRTRTRWSLMNLIDTWSHVYQHISTTTETQPEK